MPLNKFTIEIKRGLKKVITTNQMQYLAQNFHLLVQLHQTRLNFFCSQFKYESVRVHKLHCYCQEICNATLNELEKENMQIVTKTLWKN